MWEITVALLEKQLFDLLEVQHTLPVHEYIEELHLFLHLICDLILGREISDRDAARLFVYNDGLLQANKFEAISVRDCLIKGNGAAPSNASLCMDCARDTGRCGALLAIATQGVGPRKSEDFERQTECSERAGSSWSGSDNQL